MERSGRYATFDFFKILFACAVVLGHTYINFFQTWFRETHGFAWSFERLEQIAVTGFFIISGIFLAQTVETAKEKSAIEQFISLQRRRIVRLYEPVLLVTALYLIVRRFVEHSMNIKEMVLYWPNLLMIGHVNNIPANNILWYAVCLFWCTLVLSALLIAKKDWSVRLIFPLTFFFGFSFLYNKYGGLIHVAPLIAGFVSGGLLRCAVEMVFGIELFYAATAFKNSFVLKENVATKISVAALEILSVLGMTFVSLKTKMKLSGRYEFAFYPCCAVLFFIFLLRREVIFLFCKRLEKPIAFLSRYTYMLYLTHTLLIQPAKRFVDFTQYDFYTVLFVTLAVCWIFAIIVYHLNALLVRGMKAVWRNLASPIFAEIHGGGVQMNSNYLCQQAA